MQFFAKKWKKNWNFFKKNQNSKNAQSGYIFSYFSKKWIKCLTKVSFLVNMFKWKLHFWIQFFWYSAASVLTFFYHKMLLRQKMIQMEVLQPFHLPKMMNFNIKYILLRIFQCLCRGSKVLGLRFVSGLVTHILNFSLFITSLLKTYIKLMNYAKKTLSVYFLLPHAQKVHLRIIFPLTWCEEEAKILRRKIS